MGIGGPPSNEGHRGPPHPMLIQGNFQKTDVEGKSQDICQEPAVTSVHTKAFFSKIFGGGFLKTWQ